MVFCKYNNTDATSETLYTTGYSWGYSMYGPFLGYYGDNKLGMCSRNSGYNGGNFTTRDLTTETNTTLGKSNFNPGLPVAYDSEGFYVMNDGKFLIYYSTVSNTDTTLYNNTLYNYTYISEYARLYLRSGATGNPIYKITIDYNSRTSTTGKIIESYTSSLGYIRFINRLCNKVMFNSGDVYIVNNDKTIGSKLNTVTLSSSICSNGLMLVNNLFYYNKNLYEFDETTNDFVIKFQNIGIVSVANDVIILWNKTSNAIIKLIPDESSVIGFNYNNRYYPIGTVTGEVSSKVLVSTNDIYDEGGNVVTGTMPNNGVLSYTPSTSQQTIPAGYTSGGTIDAVTLTDADYDTCLDLTEDILGTGGAE